MAVSRSRFVDPPWDASVDVTRVKASIGPEAELAGMFFNAVFEGAKWRGVDFVEPPQRYLPFSFYPISEFVPILLLAAERFYPDRTLRQALRALGASAPEAFMTSTLGKVTLGVASDVHSMVEAMVKTYEINVRPSRARILESAPSSIVLRLDDVAYFLDSHHVGVFEGTLRLAGKDGSVRIDSESSTQATLLLEW